MRTCQSCGKENPDDRDFCSCGEYLRWEPTGFVQAITPEMAAEAAAQAAPPPPPADPTPPPTPTARATPPSRRRRRPPAATATRPRHLRRPRRPPAPPTANSLPVVQRVQPPQPPQPPIARTLVRGAVPPPSPAAAAERAGDDRPAPARTATRPRARRCITPSSPGQRETVLALVRNQSGIVDNYDLRVEGMPQDWWSIFPGTVYLVPFGSGGTYEQEVEIHLHPPRGPEAEARVWDLRVVADSKANSSDRRGGAAGAAHPALHRDGHDAAPAAPQGPPQGDLRRHRGQQGQRPGAGRARRRGPGRRAALRLQPPAAGDPGGRLGDLADAGPPAQADLDRARSRSAAWRSRRSPARRPPSAPRPSRWAPTSCSSRGRRRRRSGTGGARRRSRGCTRRACSSRSSTRRASPWARAA